MNTFKFKGTRAQRGTSALLVAPEKGTSAHPPYGVGGCNVSTPDVPNVIGLATGQVNKQNFADSRIRTETQNQQARVQTPDGRVFDPVGREPYQRKDGSDTELQVWESLCQVCAAPFVVRTPVDFGTTQSFGAKHCVDHRLTPAQVLALGRAAQRAARQTQRKAGGE